MWVACIYPEPTVMRQSWYPVVPGNWEVHVLANDDLLQIQCNYFNKIFPVPKI